MTDFNSSSQELASLAVSVYIAGFCFGPLVIAPLSEFYGRAPLYHVCLALFVILSVSCAVAPSLGALVVIRLLSGVAGSCPMALGPGSIADLVPREKRGTFMAAWIVGPVFGPIIGPIGLYSLMSVHATDGLTERTVSRWISNPGQRLAVAVLGVGNCGELGNSTAPMGITSH